MKSMLDLDSLNMRQTDIIGVRVWVEEGVSVCYRIPNTVSELMNTCVVWTRLDLGESTAPQTGPTWRSPICFLQDQQVQELRWNWGWMGKGLWSSGEKDCCLVA